LSYNKGTVILAPPFNCAILIQHFKKFDNSIWWHDYKLFTLSLVYHFKWCSFDFICLVTIHWHPVFLRL